MLHINIKKYDKIYLSLVPKFIEAIGPECKHLWIALQSLQNLILQYPISHLALLTCYLLKMMEEDQKVFKSAIICHFYLVVCSWWANIGRFWRSLFDAILLQIPATDLF